MAIFHHPERFLGLDDEHSDRANSAVWVLPIPMEMTTSYIGGTALGPAAIIDASNQVEFYDFEFDTEPVFEYGIHTLPTLLPTLKSPEAAVTEIQKAVTELDFGDRLLVTLGGEHTLSAGIIPAIAQKHSDLVVVQIDAHADLRDAYEGTPYSHACACRRWLPYAKTLQLGIRSGDREELIWARTSDRVTIIRADQMVRDRDYLQVLTEFVRGHPVYLTVDVDGLDPSIIRATGTPEPGGIGWYECLEIIRTAANEGHIVAADCVELAPATGEQASAFAAAKLVYKMISYVMHARGKF